MTILPAMIDPPEYFDVAVAGGPLRVARWGTGPRIVIALHGLTASSMSFRPVARHLDSDTTLVAPDLRGRGRSGRLPGPFGLGRHAEDVVAVLDHLGARRVIAVGESMGAFIAVVLAGHHPTRVDRLVLVDGGLPAPMSAPVGVKPEVLVNATMGPALDRLRRTFPSRDAYFEFWRAHPALTDGWNEDFEAYLDYDIAESSPPALRSSVSEEAVRGDALDLWERPELLPDALAGLRCPVMLLRASRGMFDEPQPGIPEGTVDHWRGVVHQLEDELVDDTNHYTICLGDRGVRRIAAHLTADGAIA